MTDVRLMNAVQARAVRAELERRRQARKAHVVSHKPTKREQTVADQLRGTYFKQQAAFFMSKARRRLAGTSRRSGKCQRVGTLVATPYGPRRIEVLKPGDEVYGWNSDNTVSVCRVTQLHDQGVQEVVDLESSGRTWASCTMEHRWLTTEAQNFAQHKVRRVHQFYPGVKVCRRFARAPLGPVHEPHAYVLAALAGNGSCRSDGVQLSAPDERVPAKVAQILGTTYRRNPLNFNHIIHVPRPPHRPSPIHHYDAWLKGRYSHEKVIDYRVLRTWDRASCLAYLAGLIDTDGCVRSDGKRLNIRIGMQAKKIIDAADYLFRALFMCETSRSVDRRDKYKRGPVYQVALTSSSEAIRALEELSPHLATPSKRLRPEWRDLAHLPLDRVGVKVHAAAYEAQCYDITVDNDTSLYLLANGLVTHNTRGCAIWFVEHLLEEPTCTMVYIAQTTGIARQLLWPELKALARQYELPFKFNEHHLEMKHARGAGVLLLRGADKKDEIEKLRGMKNDRVCLDEAQSMGPHMEELIREVLGPTLRDRSGDLIMLGTAGKLKQGIFWEAWHKKRKRKSDGKPVYEVHHWSLQDNPYLSDEARDENVIVDEDGFSGTDDPAFLREYRGQWTVGDHELMFAFDEDRNTFEGNIPGGHNFKTGFGCDFGWNDETALVVAQWAATHRVLYVPESWSKRQCYTDDVAAQAMELSSRYSSKLFVGDSGGYGKGICVHLARDYHINVLSANKREKFDHIAFFNSALRRGEVKVRRGSRLAKQLGSLVWNDNRTDSANHSRDDLVFALLYIWRHAKNSGLGKQTLAPAAKEDPLRAMALREKMDALHERKPDEPKWYLRELGSVRDSAKYSSPAWRALLGRR